MTIRYSGDISCEHAQYNNTTSMLSTMVNTVEFGHAQYNGVYVVRRPLRFITILTSPPERWRRHTAAHKCHLVPIPSIL